MDNLDRYETMIFASPSSWEEWLDLHHEDSKGIWLKIAKKDSLAASITYQEALDKALCYGWIDGQKKAYDETYWLQKFTPRSPKSVWSKVNTSKALKLIESGKMQPSGMKAVDAAKKDGRWDAAYESQKNMTVPEDFLKELEKNDRAKEFFGTLNKQNQYAICYRIHNAKKHQTRQERIMKFIDMLNNQQKLYP